MTELEQMKQAAKTTYGGIAGETGFSRSHVCRVVRGQREAPAAAKIIRAALMRRISPRPSSDPEFLAKIRRRAVPFLEARLAGIRPRILADRR